MGLKISPVDDADLTPRQPPAINPALVTMNNNGFAWRDFLVRLPAECVADDLKEPSLWRKVQTTQNSLRRHDHLYIVSFDESWIAEAIVADADRNRAILARPRITTFPERFDALFQDDVYRVIWNGSGYCVERKADGRRMTQPAATPQLAERELVLLHPQKSGQ